MNSPAPQALSRNLSLRALSRTIPVALVAALGVLTTGCGSTTTSSDAAQPSTTTVAATTARTVGCKEILAAVPDDLFGNSTPTPDQIRSAVGAQDATLTPMVDQVADPKVKSALRAYVQVLDQIKTASDDKLVPLSSGPLQTTAKALDAACPN
ncbi:hypothetical protein ACIRRA_28450 [Nocardia sp. NPDC101769]|uniref:hypothetical protein n=1 Tax=Nocardia sp. NPDC101769 TaxID=3364333 RepID=UPI003803C05E